MSRHRLVRHPTAAAGLVVLACLPAGLVRAERAAGGPPVSLSVTEAMRLSVATSELFADARAGDAGALADVVRARSELYPQIFASAGYERTLESVFEGLFGGSDGAGLSDLPFGRENAVRFGALGTQGFFSGGRILSQVRAARAGQEPSSG